MPSSSQSPFLVDVVVECVLKFLDIHTLKLCRLVCQKWNRIATLSLLREAYFWNFYDHSAHSENFKHLQQFIDSYSRNSFRNIHIRGLSTLQMYRDLKLMGPQLRKLKFYKTSFETEEESSKALFKLIEELPLQSLHMDINDSTQHIFAAVCPSCSSDNSSYLNRFRSLKELELRSFDSVHSSTLENLSKIPWSLTKLELTIDNRIPHGLIRKVLCNIKLTLAQLILNFTFSYEGYDYITENPTEDDWIIPTSLLKLQRLKIAADRGNDQGDIILCRSLIAAIQLPELRLLKLYGECAQGCYGKMVFPTLWDLQSNITALKLGSNFLDTSCFIRPIPPFPNLKRVTLYFPSIELISAILLLENLETLSLELNNDKGIQWDSVLTGIKSTHGVSRHCCNSSSTGGGNSGGGGSNRRLQRERPASRASIRYLKQLKCLKIEFPEFSQGFYFTDCFIYSGLIYLKELQYLYIRGEKFSKNALDDLRKELRPFANINLIKYQSPYELSASNNNHLMMMLNNDNN